ncbi:MAG: PAS domain-containing sensor histidine kinase [Bryobacterales bacterium]|nr:PAS domain-containing sensor histidine kinase [Bryobacterales bacterium]
MPTRLRVLGVTIPEDYFRRRPMLTVAGGVLALLAALEWASHLDYSLGILYVVPIMIAGTVFTRVQVVLAAVFCAWLRGQFHPPVLPVEFALRFLMATLAYSAAGLLVVEMTRNRRTVLAHYAQLKLEKELRMKAEAQLKTLADSSPAAIVTLNREARVLAANRAAADMFGFVGLAEMQEASLEQMVPLLANALALSPNMRHLRTSASTWAKRKDGSHFPLTTWFSTYGEGAERCLAAILVDTSEEVREREREHFRHLLDYNRLLAGAVSHEIRNLCSAITVVSSNLARNPGVQGDADFQALTTLVEGLSRLASFELGKREESAIGAVDVRTVLDQLRVVIEPDWADVEGEVHIEEPARFPLVHADAHGLLQVFLNLAQNSLRAVAGAEQRALHIRLAERDGQATISFVDTGPGVASLENLFHPFRPGSDGSGLGLYISRTLVRSFQGDLVYVPVESGCRFDVIVAITGTDSTSWEAAEQNEPEPTTHPAVSD